MSNNDSIVTVDNYISGKFVPPSSGKYLEVINPANDCQIGKVGVSCVADVESGVAAAEKAFPVWSKLTIKARAAIVSCFVSIEGGGGGICHSPTKSLFFSFYL